MKGSIVSVFLPFFILNVCAARVYDEKSDALKEIDMKFSQVLALGNTTLKSVEGEKALVNNKGEEELKKYLNTKVAEARVQFDMEANAVIRTAIVQSKPMTVIYCIRQVVYSSNRQFADFINTGHNRVLQIRIGKLEKIDFDVNTIKAIISGIKELVDQGKKKINDGTGVIQIIKKETLDRCESATLLLGEIEICLHEPILMKEYAKLRQTFDRDIKTLKANLNNELNKCLTAPKQLIDFNM